MIYVIRNIINVNGLIPHAIVNKRHYAFSKNDEEKPNENWLFGFLFK